MTNTIPMGRLFWKIFLWFWLTLVLIAAAVSWGTAIYINNADAYQQKDLRSRYINNRIELLRQMIYYGGEDAASDMLENKRLSSNQTKFYVVDDTNQDILGRVFDIENPNIIEHEPVESVDGDIFKVFSEQNPKKANTLTRMLRPFQRSPIIYFMWLGIAVLLSVLVCFGLARYLSHPIRKLQIAAKQLADGSLDTRVTQTIGNRRDEIADLGHDFDSMADQLQRSMNIQKQLLSDISHELRSPLARMQLAIGLARKKLSDKAPEEIDRIEKEAERLDQLVGQSLTLSRLDAGAAYPKDDLIDVGKLLESIVENCNFEAKEKQKTISLETPESYSLQANGELLHRALENIIRNAIHYTKVNTNVEIQLTKKQNGFFEIIVQDKGDGVPVDKIDSLFEPFIRLSEARDRDSGGYGLGLAIAKRAIEFHQGQLNAQNHKNGLRVIIKLPIKDFQ